MSQNFWEKLKKPVVVMAPMSGVSDEPFRLMFLKYGKPSVFWTEFVSAEGLFSKGRNYCLNILKFSKKERPIVAQLFGSDPVYFEKAAQLIAELGFDGVDINMGCPDREIEKQGAGSALIKNPELAVKLIRAAKKSGLPVSVKTRIGYDKNEIDKWITTLLKENISALTVHLRTREELSYAPAHWELAKKIVKLRDKYSPKTLILGNGDIKSLVEAKRITEATGLDGIMIGRGLIGNPWFFTEKNPTVSERLKAIIKHAELFDDFHKEDMKKRDYYKKFASIKKHFHAYTKNFVGAKDLREKLMNVKNTAEVKIIIKNFLKQA